MKNEKIDHKKCLSKTEFNELNEGDLAHFESNSEFHSEFHSESNSEHGSQNHWEARKAIYEYSMVYTTREGLG